MTNRVPVFCSYATKDERHFNHLEEHLSPLGIIRLSTPRTIAAGRDQAAELNRIIDEAQLIIVLLSSAYFKSNECGRAGVEDLLRDPRHSKFPVIPILVRDCHLVSSPLTGRQIFPRDSKPVPSRPPKRDAFWAMLAKEIHRIAESLLHTAKPLPSDPARSRPAAPKSSKAASNNVAASASNNHDKAKTRRNTIDYAGRLTNIVWDFDFVKNRASRQCWERLLKCAPPMLVRNWIQVASPLPKEDGAISPLLVGMWREANLLNAVPYVEALDGRIDLASLSAYYVKKKTFWSAVTQQEPNYIGSHVRAREAEFDWAEEAWDHSHLLAGPLFEFAWDVVGAPLDVTQSAFSVCWWDAAGGVLDTIPPVTFPWPAADLPEFSSYGVLARRWNKAYSKAILYHQQTPKDRGLADKLAYDYVESYHRLWHGERWASRTWPSLVSHLFAQTAPKTPTDHAFMRWVRSLPLLAAPESGLSTDVATAILSGVKMDDGMRSELRELRRARARRCLHSRRSEALLAKIDATFPSHPWISQVGANAIHGTQ